ncbi:hypothetical protein OROMI_022895 [Orobanche minor]
MKADMKMDRWGYEVRTTSDACISAINSYYDQVLSYGRNRSVILEAPKSDPECVLGNILAAHFLCSSGSARQLIQAAKSQLEQGSTYEKAVFEALIYLISPDRDDDVAVEMHSKLLQDFPRDLVSLKRAQVLCFYMGQPDLSLKLVEQVLPVNVYEDYIYGMLSFALLELGRMEDAEDAGKRGFEINKDDPWSQHALCHVYQYECHFKEAVEFMSNCARSWSSLSSFMYTHNWWHVALCYLEGHAPIEKVRNIYDEFIWKELEKSDSVPAEDNYEYCPRGLGLIAEKSRVISLKLQIPLNCYEHPIRFVYLNAVGLLLRVYIRGEHDYFEDRLKNLAKCVTDQAFWFMEWHLDILILWALSYTREFDSAEELLEGLKSRIFMMSKKKQQVMQRGLSLAEALYKYGKGDNEQALGFLGHDFDAANYKIIGASNEQIDVFAELHIVLLLNTGEADKAIHAIEKQLKKRAGSPFLWRLLPVRSTYFN